MKVLVTGATGFVGRFVTAALMARGATVVGTVRTTASADRLPAGAIPVCVSDIDTHTDWTSALEGVDTVVHLAARVHVMQEHAADPLAAFRRVNVAATERLARMASEQGVRRFIFMSSIKVNGESTPVEKPFKETDLPSPQDAYGQSKWEAEQVLQQISQISGMPVISFRIPLVYGPEVKGNFLRLLKIVQSGFPLPLANIDNRRSILYVENLADLLCHCAMSPKTVAGLFLVSDGEDLSTPLLLQRLSHLQGKSSKIFSFPQNLLKITAGFLGKTAEYERLAGSLCIDSHRVCSSLEWSPPFTVEEGLVRTLAWYRGQL